MANNAAAGAPVQFQTLWDNYPNSDPCVNPKTGKKAYDDQCAIRLGLALQKSGISFASFRGPRCEFGPAGNGMVLRARELADWLRTRPFPGCPTPTIWTGATFRKGITGRTGIVFFHGYWLRTGEKFPTGDHIDLWKRDRLTPSFTTFLRFTLGISHVPNPFGPGNYYSDLENSREVLFWQIP